MINLTRREFLRIAATMGGASLFAGCTLFAEDRPVPAYIQGAPGVDPLETLSGVRNVYSVCGLCAGNCGICCRVAQGTLVKIGGSPYHPISNGHPLAYETALEEAPARGGSVCAVGGSGIQTLYDPFRVAKPLKRVGPRGSGKWRGIPWETAFKEITEGGNLFGEGTVEGLKGLKGSQAGMTFLVGPSDWGALTFLKGFLGAVPGAALARDRDVELSEIARQAGDAVFGPGTGPVDADYRNARFVLSFGDAPLDSGTPLVSLARDIADARVADRGLKWAVVDPKLSTSGSKADLWVPIVPGRDADLALGILVSLMNHHPAALRVSRESIEKLLQGRTADECARSSGVSVDMMRKLAEMAAQGGPLTAFVAGKGILGQAAGLETAKLILSLNTVLGSAPGKGGLTARSDAYFARAEKKLLGTPAKETAATGFDRPTGALILWNSDPVYSARDAAGGRLSDRTKVPLFVAIETHITETSALADYILPDTTYLERWDVCVSPPSVTAPGFGVRSPVVGAIDEKAGKYYPVVPETALMEDIVIGLAVHLGIPGYGPDAPGGVKNAWDYYRRALDALRDSVVEADGIAAFKTADVPGIVARGGLFGTTAPKAPQVREQPPSARSVLPEIRVSSQKSEEAPGFLLISYTLPFHRSPRSGVNSWLLEVLPENRLLMNTADARKLGIRQGDRVTVEPFGAKDSYHCIAQLVPGIMPGVTALARGFGYRQSGAGVQEIDGTATSSDRPRGAGLNSAALFGERGPARVMVRKA